MLGHRLRRRPNIKPTLPQCVVSAGLILKTLSHRISSFANSKQLEVAKNYLRMSNLNQNICQSRELPISPSNLLA